MTALRTLVEDKVVELLETLLLETLPDGEAGGYLASVQPYPGDLSPTAEDPDFKALLAAGTPCIGVTTGDGTYGDVRLARLDADLDFTVELLVVSGNRRSADARIRGDGVSADPGIYQVIEDVRALLSWIDLGVEGAGGVTPVSERAVIRGRDLTVWHLVFDITGDVVQPRPDELDDYYETIRNRVNDANGSGDADPLVEGDIDLEVPA